MDRARIDEVFTPAAVEALKAFPIDPEPPQLVMLSENVSFRVKDRRDGADYVLRLHRPGYHTHEELNSERTWTRALSESGIAVPIGLPSRSGEDYVRVAIPALGQERQAGMARWTEGEPLSDVLQRSKDPALTEHYYEQLGALEAAMHDQASAWRPPASFRRHSLDRDGLMGDAPFWGPFWEHPVFSPAERTLVLATRDRIRDVMDRFGKDPSHYGMIHADLHPDNLLVGGERLTVIDFDDCGFGWHVYDIAVALYQMQGGRRFEALQAAFLRGYRRHRALDDATAALIPMFLLVRGLAVIGWLLQRPEIDASARIVEMKNRVCAQCEAFEAPL
ncbi:MAG TPA: phosphotransferase [Caulobacteraceae bacterium]|jgi:Ser/Thr protein kinase RdoA (MazF antagonist)|nr:phosphotransferase [Caulobacteraceae bacterium]